MDKLIESVKRAAHRLRARAVHWLARAHFRTRHSATAHSGKIELLVWLLLIGGTALVADPLQRLLMPVLKSDLVEDIQSLLLATGGALIGATAIASSFVLFATQVNIERLPYGLFKRLSSDRKLLGAFAGSLLIAVGIASLSLVQDPAYIGVALLTAAWSGLMTLRLLLYAYRRSLYLIGPLEQLALLCADGVAEMRRWNRWVRWMTPVLPPPVGPQGQPEPNFDQARLRILQANPGWYASISHSIRQAASFARRAGEQGDREVAAAALSSMVALNAGYIATRGRTFFYYNAMIETDLDNDPVITDTLEQLRRLCRSAAAREDEVQLELIFQTYLGLVGCYLSISYAGGDYSEPTHADLAAGYLEHAIESVVPHALVDTLMEGERLLGKAAQAFLAKRRPLWAASRIKKIAQIGALGAVKANHRPVTRTGMEQFRDFTLQLLKSDSHDLHYLIGELRGSVLALAKLFLNVSDPPLESIHSTYLGPFYSSTGGFKIALGEVANAIVAADAENEGAKRVAGNLEQWANGLYQSQKELLLLAVEKRSRFVFDHMHWIADVSEILYVVSQADACPDHASDELEKHALWLFSTLTWIPRDAETVVFVENWGFIDAVFDFGRAVHRRGSIELLSTARKLLFSWGFEGGQREQGWETLTESLAALAALALLNDGDAESAALIASLTARLAADGAPDQQLRDDTAAAVRALCDGLHPGGIGGGAVAVLGHMDHARTTALLTSIADLLSPPAADG